MSQHFLVVAQVKFIFDITIDYHTGADTFSHFELLIEEHRQLERQRKDQMISGSSNSSNAAMPPPSRLKQLVPTVGTFHTHLPLRQAFEFYNAKHCLTKRKHIQISFNEIRHILNLAQIMAMRQNCDTAAANNGLSTTSDTSRGTAQDSKHDAPADDKSEPDLVWGEVEDTNSSGPPTLRGPKMITFDGDQTLYSDGANFESNPKLATYLWLLLKHGVTVAVVTAAGYEYNVDKYEFRLSGLLAFFQTKGLTAEECDRFYLFGGECNYLLNLGSDFHLHPVKELGPGGWLTSTRYLPEAPGNWAEENVQRLLDLAEETITKAIADLNMRGRIVRKRRSVGLIPQEHQVIPREALDETVLRMQEKLQEFSQHHIMLPFCAFNGGKDVWMDIGNKRVGVQILQSYLGIPAAETLHIGDQFLNTGNDFAARDVCPCIWITSPEETTYILKTILRLAEVPITIVDVTSETDSNAAGGLDFAEIERRTRAVKRMDVYTGEIS